MPYAWDRSVKADMHGHKAEVPVKNERIEWKLRGHEAFDVLKILNPDRNASPDHQLLPLRFDIIGPISDVIAAIMRVERGAL